MNERKKARQSQARRLAEIEHRAQAHNAFKAVVNRSKTSVDVALACFADEAYELGAGLMNRMDVVGSWWATLEHRRCPDGVVYRFAVFS